MRFKTRKATIADVHWIAQDLSELNRAELKSMFGPTWWTALKVIKGFLEAGESEVFLDDKGNPLCVFGHMGHINIDGARVTWTLATQTFFDMGVKITVMGRKYLRNLRKRYPGVNFYTYTRSEHPDADRWFRLLGYVPAPEVAIGFKTYVLPLETADRRDLTAGS